MNIYRYFSRFHVYISVSIFANFAYLTLSPFICIHCWSDPLLTHWVDVFKAVIILWTYPVFVRLFVVSQSGHIIPLTLYQQCLNNISILDLCVWLKYVNRLNTKRIIPYLCYYKNVIFYEWPILLFYVSCLNYNYTNVLQLTLHYIIFFG